MMNFSLKKVVLAVIAAIATTTGATNCHGSNVCVKTHRPYKMEQLQRHIHLAITAGCGGDYFKPGEHIACVPAHVWGGYCAFFQKGAEGNLTVVGNHVTNLIMHGCKTCGSDPTVPDEHVGEGELTINFVSHPKCMRAYCGRDANGDKVYE